MCQHAWTRTLYAVISGVTVLFPFQASAVSWFLSMALLAARMNALLTLKRVHSCVVADRVTEQHASQPRASFKQRRCALAPLCAEGRPLYGPPPPSMKAEDEFGPNYMSPDGVPEWLKYDSYPAVTCRRCVCEPLRHPKACAHRFLLPLMFVRMSMGMWQLQSHAVGCTRCCRLLWPQASTANFRKGQACEQVIPLIHEVSQT